MQSLDYNKQKLYNLTVQATDARLSSVCNVIITISDTNSHRPIFDKSSYQATVNENVAVGKSVITVHASDDDVGENARITYSFEQDVE